VQKKNAAYTKLLRNAKKTSCMKSSKR